MEIMTKIKSVIDNSVRKIARFGAWASIILMSVIVFDVLTRYFGLPKPFGLNATQIQESEYWIHTFLFASVIGYAYTKEAHVRIDIIRSRISKKAQNIIEIMGCIVFLIPLCAIAIYYHSRYTLASFYEGEVSKSVIGLGNIWIVKSFLILLFVLLLMTAISKLIKIIKELKQPIYEQENQNEKEKHPL